MAGLQGLLGTPNTAHAVNYPGNGGNGFNGAVGNGMLAVNNNGTGGFTFSYTLGGGQTNLGGNDIVLYVDTGSGNGIGTSTALLNDAGDGGRKAVSGFTDTNNNNGPGRSTSNFGGLLSPKFGIDMSVDFANIFTLANSSGNNGFVFNGGAAANNGTNGGGVTYTVVTGGGSTVLTANIPAVNFGLSSFSGKTLKFLAIEVSETGFSSNEATVTLTGNSGFGNTQTVSSATANTFTAAVPEPGTWAMLAAGFGALVSIQRIRRLVR